MSFRGNFFYYLALVAIFVQRAENIQCATCISVEDIKALFVRNC